MMYASQASGRNAASTKIIMKSHQPTAVVTIGIKNMPINASAQYLPMGSIQGATGRPGVVQPADLDVTVPDDRRLRV